MISGNVFPILTELFDGHKLGGATIILLFKVESGLLWGVLYIRVKFYKVVGLDIKLDSIFIYNVRYIYKLCSVSDLCKKW